MASYGTFTVPVTHPLYFTINSTISNGGTYISTISTTNGTGYYWQDIPSPRIQQRAAAGYVAPREIRQHRPTLERQSSIVRAHTISAQSRAIDLLLSHMSEDQIRAFQTENAFIVIGGKTGKRYRIIGEDHLAANIEVLAANNDNAELRLCAHPELSAVPLGDHLLAQKLMLEFDEERFLRLANRHAA